MVSTSKSIATGIRDLKSIFYGKKYGNALDFCTVGICKYRPVSNNCDIS